MEEVVSEFYKSVGPELEQEKEDEDCTKLYFPFERETWDRYDSFCQNACPLWGCKSHNEKITMIIEMAEKYYAWVTSQEAKTGSDSAAAGSYTIQADGVRCRDEFIRLSGHLPLTPQKSRAPERSGPPSTPTKAFRGSWAARSAGSHVCEETFAEKIGHISFPLKDPTEKPSAATDTKAGTLSTPEPMEMIQVRMDSLLRNKYTKFFQRHGWAARTESEKVAILLEIAKRLDDIVVFRDIEVRRARINRAISQWKSSSVINTTSSVTRVSSDVISLRIPIAESALQWYNDFFEYETNGPDTNHERFEFLLGLAETYLDLGMTYRNLRVSLLKKQPTNSARASVSSTRNKPRNNLSKDEAVPFLLWITRNVKDRYNKFFKKHDWATETDETKMITLLDLAQAHPALRPRVDVPEETETVGSNRLENEDDADEEESIASDGTWDDEAETRDLEEEMEVTQPTTQSQADPGVKWLRLLKPDYYLKFSEAARKTKPAGSKRSLAAMMNTRKHIVERHQLKQLIAQCRCSNFECDKKIKKKSIKITELSWTIKVTAHCEKRGSKHRFEWISSAKLPHRGGGIYTLNVAVPAAVQLSGNNVAKVDHFAKVLRVSWAQLRANFVLLPVLKSAVRKCFEITEHEMVETLRKETGQIVLAGDGQFDSPGSCATLCTYTLMALGVDEQQDDGSKLLKRCEYIISQAVIDRRHADNKSVSMERVGLHWALQPIIRAGIKVTELVTDDHIQISSDFRKTAAAVREQESNAANGTSNDTALRAFQDSLSTALLRYQPQVDVPAGIMALLSFYSGILHSNDIWHRAKNLLKNVSTIAQSAPANEQQTYKKYAKMLRNYLWDCAKQAQGSEQKFLDMWKTVQHHLHDNHANCDATGLHSKTKLMGKLDQTSRSFGLLIRCLRRVDASAPQLCRFRKTGVLEGFNGLTLKYCPKRIRLPYDTMVMKRDLAALDHNHHVMRDIRRRKDGQPIVTNTWKKSTKAFFFAFQKEEKDYKYIGHLMAAVLAARCEYSHRLGRKVSAVHPRHIQPNLASAAAGSDQSEAMKEARSHWLSKQRVPRNSTAPKPAAIKSKPKTRRDSSSDSSWPSWTPPRVLTSESEDDTESDESGNSGSRIVKSRKRKRACSDHEWRPEDSDDSEHKKRRVVAKSGGKVGAKAKKTIKTVTTVQISEISQQLTEEPARESFDGTDIRLKKVQTDTARETDDLEEPAGPIGDQEVQKADQHELVEQSHDSNQGPSVEILGEQVPESSGTVAEAVKRRSRAAALNCRLLLKSGKTLNATMNTVQTTVVKRDKKKELMVQCRQELESSESDGLHVLGVESDADGDF